MDSIHDSVQFSHLVVLDSLRPHGLQHARPPCPSPTPRVYSDSCPLSWWCHPTISSSVVPFSSRLQSFPAKGSFPMSQFFASGGQSIGVSDLASVLPMNIQDWFPSGLTAWIVLRTEELLRVLQHHSSKASILRCSAFFTVRLSHSHMTTGKTIALARWTFVGKVMSPLFYMHSLLEKCKSKLHWDITSHQSEWPFSKSLQTVNAGEGVEKRECSCTVGGNVNGYSHYGRWYGDSLKN